MIRDTIFFFSSLFISINIYLFSIFANLDLYRKLPLIKEKEDL